MNSRTLIKLEKYYLKKLKDIDAYINIIKTKNTGTVKSGTGPQIGFLGMGGRGQFWGV